MKQSAFFGVLASHGRQHAREQNKTVLAKKFFRNSGDVDKVRLDLDGGLRVFTLRPVYRQPKSQQTYVHEKACNIKCKLKHNFLLNLQATER